MVDKTPDIELDVSFGDTAAELNTLQRSIVAIAEQVKLLGAAFNGLNITSNISSSIPNVKAVQEFLRVKSTADAALKAASKPADDQYKLDRAQAEDDNKRIDAAAAQRAETAAERQKRIAEQQQQQRIDADAENARFDAADSQRRVEAAAQNARNDAAYRTSRAEAEAENQRIDAASMQRRIDAGVTNAAIDAAASQRRIEAAAENSRFDAAYRTERSLAEDQNIRISAAEHQRRVEAAAENARVDAAYRTARAQAEDDNKRIDAAQKKRLAEEAAARKEAAGGTPAAPAANPAQASLNRVVGAGAGGTFAIQAALLANYAVLGGALAGISAGIKFTIDLDQALHNLQAISASTNTEMLRLKTTIVAVSEASRFSAVEVTNAGTTLAQAGLSSTEIDAALKAVVLLATATGSDLAQSVDLATSVMGAFNLRASEMTNVANTLTAATNLTKLTIDKIALGFQYAGNLANEAGLSVSELTASLGVMANAGIRSGSTLGTGMRQILVGLQDPSEKLISVLHRLGLTTEDVNLHTHSFSTVLHTLHDAGFTAGDGLQVFETRAAAALSALLGRTDEIDSLNQSIIGTSAAFAANSVQLESFSNTMAKFSNVLGVVVSTAIGPFLELLQKSVSSFTGFFTGVSQATVPLQIFGTLLSSIISALAITYLARLIGQFAIFTRGLFTISAAAAVAQTSLYGTAAASVAAEAGLTVATTATKGLSFALLGLNVTPLGLLFTALAVGISAFTLASSLAGEKTQALSDKMDAATAAATEANSALNEQITTAASVAEAYADVQDKSESLKTHQEEFQTTLADLKSRFGDLQAGIFDNVQTVGDLIDAFEKLQKVLDGQTFEKADFALAQIDAKMKATNELVDKARKSGQVDNLFNSLKTFSGGYGGFASPVDTTSPAVASLRSGANDALDDPTKAQAFLTTLLKSRDSLIKSGVTPSTADAFIDGLSKLVAAKASLLPDLSQKADDQRKASVATVDGYLQQFGISKTVAQLTQDQSAAVARSQNATTAPEQASAADALVKTTEALKAFLTYITTNKDVRSGINNELQARGLPIPTDATYKGLIQSSFTGSSVQGGIDKSASTQATLKSAVAETQAEILKAAISGAKAQQQTALVKTDELNSDTKNSELFAQARAAAQAVHDAQADAIKTSIDLTTSKIKQKLSADEKNAANDSELTKALTDIDKSQADIRQKQADILRTNQAQVAKNTVDTLQRSYSAKLSNVLPSETEENVQARIDGAGKILEQMHQAAVAELEIELRNPRIGAAEAAGKRADLAAAYAQQIDAFHEKSVSLLDAAATPLKAAAKASDLAEKKFQVEKAQYDVLLRQLADPVQSIQNQIDAAGLYKNAGQIGPLQVAKLQRDLENAQTDQLAGQVAILAAQGTSAKNRADAIALSVAVDSAQVKKMRAEVVAAQAALDANPNDQAAKSRLISTNDDLNKASDALTEQTDKYGAATAAAAVAVNDLSDAEGKLKSRTDDANETMQQALANVLEYAKGTDGTITSVAVTIENTLKAGVDSARSGVVQFFDDVRGGTKSIKDDFKDLGLSMVDAMLKVVESQAAAQLVGLLAQLAGSIAGGFTSGSGAYNGQGRGFSGASGGTGGGGIGGFLGGLFSMFFANGGIVHAANGYHNPNRDSVGAMLRPGEGVLRKSAVDNMGIDAFNNLNAMGNSTVSKSSPIAYTPPKPREPDTVNVWNVSKDQVPPPGPKDIIATVGDNLNNGGSLRVLVKKIALGNG